VPAWRLPGGFITGLHATKFAHLSYPFKGGRAGPSAGASAGGLNFSPSSSPTLISL
jgi:hypothetical protein